MKRLALVLILASSTVLAADRPTLPPNLLCMKIKGLDRISCDGGVPIVYSDFSLDLIKEVLRVDAFWLGFDAANAYYPPPLTSQQEKQRELGRKVIAAAPYLIFPELGDIITKDTPAVAYCSSSIGEGTINPWDVPAVHLTKPSGKGKCEDLMVVYLRPAGK